MHLIVTDLVFESPHLPDGRLDDLAEVGLVLCQRDQLGLHLSADGLSGFSISENYRCLDAVMK